MALLFMESFDHYTDLPTMSSRKWDNNVPPPVAGAGSVVSIAPTGGRRGSGSFRWVTGSATNPQGFIGRTYAGGSAVGVCGFGFRTTGAGGPTGLQIAVFYGASSQLYLTLNSDLTVSVLRGTHSGTYLGVSSIPLAANMYTYIEWKVLIADAGGTIELRFDGQTVFSFTGDTQAVSPATWNVFCLGQVSNPSNTNSASRTLDYDDVYVLDGTGPAPWNDFLGDCRVDARFPANVGSSTGWAVSPSGVNYAAVDDATPNDDSDYTVTVPPATDTFVFQDAVAGKPILGVQHCLSMKKTNEAQCFVAPVTRHAGVDYVGGDILPSFAGYVCGLQIATVNPGTGGVWTEAEFNAAEFGYRRTV